jgi:Fe2+ transport system protein B
MIAFRVRPRANKKQKGCKESIQHGLAKFRFPELKAVFITEFLRSYSYVEQATDIHRAVRVTLR